MNFLYKEAGDLGKAAEHYLQAAERALRVYAYHEAIDYFRSAFTIRMDPFPDGRGFPTITALVVTTSASTRGMR